MIVDQECIDTILAIAMPDMIVFLIYASFLPVVASFIGDVAVILTVYGHCTVSA